MEVTVSVGDWDRADADGDRMGTAVTGWGWGQEPRDGRGWGSFTVPTSRAAV